MVSNDRVRAYAKQRGISQIVFPGTFGKLTPRQQRRIRHKENRAEARREVRHG